MNEERMQVLQMIADGKIDAAQGAELLRAVEQKEPAQDSSGKARRLVIRVWESGDKSHNIKVPLAFAGSMLKFARRFVPEEELDLDGLYQAVAQGQLGQILEVDSADGTRVEIWLEA